MYIVITRPYKLAIRSAKTLESLGYKYLLSPALTIVSCEKKWIDKGYTGVIFTSQAALNAYKVNAFPTHLTCYIVGKQSQLMASRLGFTNIKNADGNSQDLAHLIIKKCDPQKEYFLFLTTQDGKKNIQYALSKHNFKLDVVYLYKTNKIDVLPQNVINAIKKSEVSFILFYSRKSAEIIIQNLYKENILESAQKITALCLSHDIGDLLKQHNWHKIHVSKKPNEESLFDSLKKLTKNTSISEQ